jgi:AcrR family transcriptional regulator
MDFAPWAFEWIDATPKMTDRSVFVNHRCPDATGTLWSVMPKIDASTAALRRANILDAARHCFAVHGIHVSVDEICAKAGVSKGAFYVYFDSKDAAIQALAEDHTRIVHEFAELDSVDALVRRLAELTTARSATSNRLELETWTHAMKMPSLRSALWRNIDGLRHSIEAGVRKVEAHSSTRNKSVSSQTAAEILSIFSLGLIAWSALGADRGAGSSESALRELLALLLGSDRRPSRQPKKRTARRVQRPAAASVSGRAPARRRR